MVTWHIDMLASIWSQKEDCELSPLTGHFCKDFLQETYKWLWPFLIFMHMVEGERGREREREGRGRRRVEEQPIVLVLVFHLVWGRVSCSQLCGTSPKNSPVSASHLTIGMLGLQVLATTSIFYLGSRKSSYLCGKSFMHWAIVSLDHDDLSKDFLLRLLVCTAKPQAINKLDEAPPLTHTDLAKLQFPFYGAWNPGGIFQSPEHTITISSSLIGVSCERPQCQIHQGFSDRFLYRQKADFIPKILKTEDYILHSTVSYLDLPKTL